MTPSILLRLALPLALAAAATAQPTLVDAMSQELARNFQALQDKADPPPYFLSYEITQEDVYNVSGTLGAIDTSGGGKSRTLDVSVRVGSPKLDNYHRVRGAGGGAAQFTSGAQITYEDNANSIKHRLWEETDRAYRAAAERLIRIQTNTQVKVAEQDASADFSSAPPEVSLAAPVKLKFDIEEWTGRIRKLSERFRNYPGVLTSQVTVSGQAETRYFVNTEGTRLEFGRGYARIFISASAKAADGADVANFESFEAEDAGGLPDDKTVLAAIDRVAKDVTALLQRARSRAVRGAGHSFRPRGGRVLPRDFRPSRRRLPAEGRGRGPDLHQERRHKGAARFPIGDFRSHAAFDGGRGPLRLVRLRR